MKTSSNSMDTYFDSTSGVLGSTKITTLHNDLNSITSSNRADVASRLNSTKVAIDNLKSINFTKLISDINSISTAKTSIPSTNSLEVELKNLNISLNNLNFVTLDNSFINLNSSLNNLWSLKNVLISTLDNIFVNGLSNLPSFTILNSEINKINTTISNLACVNNILQIVTTINNTLIILPSSMTSMLSQFGDLKGKISSLDFSGLTSKLSAVKI